MAINKRKVQEVNAGSMADISFLLLIFFLVATTMNTDTGISRILPPLKLEVEESMEKERNLLKVFVNLNDELMVNMERIQVDQLRPRVKEFILNVTGDPLMPEIQEIEIEGLGVYPVSNGIVSLRNDRGTTYGMYIRVQNELTKVFNELRDEASLRNFGKPYSELTPERQKAIQEAVPLKISEAETREIGG